MKSVYGKRAVLWSAFCVIALVCFYAVFGGVQ